MTYHDEYLADTSTENPGAHRFGRERAKRFAAIVFSLFTLAIVCKVLWDSGDDGPAQAVAPSEAGVFGKLSAHQPEPAFDQVIFPELADLLTPAGMTAGTGRVAAPLTFRDSEGAVGSLEQHRGKVILIVFWGTGCGPCLVELPRLQQLVDRYDKSELLVLPVCVDEPDAAKARETAARVAPHLTVYADADGSAKQAYFVHHLPQEFLLDRQGRMVGRSSGNVQWAGKEVERLLSTCLGRRSGAVSDDDDL